MNEIALPRLPITGGCQCGKVRYALKSVPTLFYLCHCAECQKQSSSAFGESMWVATADVEITGPLSRFNRKTDSGGVIACDYCPDCGTRLFHGRVPEDDEMAIKAGTLDDTSWLRPAGHIWTGSKQPWVQIPQGDIAYEGQPSNYEAIEQRWRIMIGQ
jgi:hypothetical protein